MLTLGLIVLSACTSDPTLDESVLDGYRHLSGSGRSDRDALYSFEIPVLPGDTAMSVSVTVEDGYDARVHELRNPAGEVVYSFDGELGTLQTRSSARFAIPVSTLNWPIDASDAPLEPGVWTFAFKTHEGEFTQFRRRFDIDVLFKEDDDLTAGRLALKLVYADGTREEGGYEQAVDAAMAWVTELYGESGIDVRLRAESTDLTDIGLVLYGDSPEAFLEISSDTAIGEIPIVFVRDLPGTLRAESGGYPAPLIPSRQSAVVVALEDFAGPDGTLDAQDGDWLGSVIAHEVGHYLGVPHVVELDWLRHDALEDTPMCDDEEDCLESLADYLMFPVDPCEDQSCTPQRLLTEDQIAVMQHNVGVE